jgi:glycosyltransferase involved in cell wall biosynthesis
VRVLFGAGARDGPAWYRCELPSRWLTAHAVSASVKYDVVTPADFEGVTAVVLQRTRSPQAPGAVHELRRRGVLVAYELDDDIWRMPEWNPLRRHFTKDVLSQMERVIAACDLVIATTSALAEILYRMNREVRVIPNGIDLSLVPAPVRRERTTVRIGWAGSGTHEGDLKMAEAALKRVLELRPEVELVFLGWAPAWTKGLNRVEQHAWVPADQLYTRLAEIDLDLAIAPLAEHRFNISKSSVKTIEYGALGLPVVASDVGPYRCIENGVTGYRVKDNRTDLWQSLLLELVTRVDDRRAMGERAREWAETQTMDQTGPEWMRVLGCAVPAELAEVVA